MQKIDSENTSLYQKIWTFYPENQKTWQNRDYTQENATESSFHC